METMKVDGDKPENHPAAVTARIAKVHRLVEILTDELKVEDKAEVAGWEADEWENLGRIDFDRRQAANPTKTRFTCPSDSTVRAVRALLPPFEGVVIEGVMPADYADPFEGLAG